MRSSAPRQRKQYLAIASVICMIYIAHISISTIIKLHDTCHEKKYNSERLNKIVRVSANREAVASFLNYSEKVKYQQPRTLNTSKHFVSLLNLTRTDYFSCEDFKKLPSTTQAVAENFHGNRGISFLKLRINGLVVPAVYKEANRVLRTFADEYKYNSAKREIEYLTKLRGLPGIPRILGSCIQDSSIRYFAERIKGHTICNDNGTTPKCFHGEFILGTAEKSPDPPMAALTVAYTTMRLFKLLEERHLVLEDISGINLMFSNDFEVFLVDADSLVFYNQTRLFSKLLCTTDEHCPGPSGNLWAGKSLNARIYAKCADLQGICENGKCRGFDTSLHACGIANWYFCRLTKFFDVLPKVKKEFEEVCNCLRQIYPQHRCSFTFATQRIYNLMNVYANTRMDQTR